MDAGSSLALSFYLPFFSSFLGERFAVVLALRWLVNYSYGNFYYRILHILPSISIQFSLCIG